MKNGKKPYKILWLLTLLLVMASCKSKKKNLSGDEPVEASDFVAFFQPVKLPFLFADTLLQRREKDSLLISEKVFSQFVPDSLLSLFFGKNTRRKIYPLGQASASDDEKYLFVKAIAGNKKAAYILVFDNDDKYVTAIEALRAPGTPNVQRIASIDKNYTITKTLSRKNADGSTSEGKDIYSYSADSRAFSLIMTDALGDQVSEIINPIDTVSRKHKYAGDYSNAKMSLVSIRDGRKSDRLSFFIHFERNEGACSGELKGEAMLRSATMAEYRMNGDPCVLQFRFTNNAVTLKELEGCGAHRGLRCSFDGVYPRKKEVKAKTKKTVKR